MIKIFFMNFRMIINLNIMGMMICIRCLNFKKVFMFKYLFVFMIFGLIVILGFVGNILVIFVVWFYK